MPRAFRCTRRTARSTAYVEVAQRPPEQPLFGRRFLEWAIQKHPDMPLLHLGDVVDMSCQSEWHRMRRIFDTGEQAKVILPGNHDGLLFGIFNHDLLTDYLNGDVARVAARLPSRLRGRREVPASSDGKGPALEQAHVPSRNTSSSWPPGPTLISD
ncbi:MAG: hypothetical protein M0C28_11980 [Candidatus Moduliflexus flocculans]|nr:hypothetical protein [Candidatus Moduliflexus flocculans]